MVYDLVELGNVCPHCGKEVFIIIEKNAAKTLVKAMKTGRFSREQVNILLLTPEEKDKLEDGDF